MSDDELTIVMPEISKDQISNDLRTLTAILDRRAPEMTAHGILGGEHGYGAEFANDVFEMHPFWWGDCECGHEDREGAWEEQNKHAPECYQSRIDWDAPREQVVVQVERLCAEMNLDPVFGSWVHCTCYRGDAHRAWVDANPHPGDCPVVRPNFRHHASGFEVRWYKYIGRDMEHEPVGRDQWAAIIRQCIQSVSERG